jgi:hypothetical protein
MKQLDEARFRFLSYLVIGTVWVVLGIGYRVWELWFFLTVLPDQKAWSGQQMVENLKLGGYDFPLEYLLVGFGILLIAYPVLKGIWEKRSGL